MVRLKIKDDYYKIIDSYNINTSSREVSFSNVRIDFTDKTILDLPLKYQECKLVDVEEEYNNSFEETNVIYTGYIDSFVLPSMKDKLDYRELELELLSPLALATRRTITIIGFYELNDLVDRILQPLYNDGFKLVEKNITSSGVKVNFLIETVESAMNKLSNKFNFWWFIDENKNIYINSIEYQFAKKPKLEYNDKLEGLINITPSMNLIDYCNVINFTNVRVWQFSYMGDFTYNEVIYSLNSNPFINSAITVNEDDEVEFIHPIDITIKNIVKSNDENLNNKIFNNYKYYALDLKFTYQDNTNGEVYIRTDKNGAPLSISNNLSLNGKVDGKDFEFIRDGMFSNLITGFRYHGTKRIIKFDLVFSCSSLMWTRMKFNNLSEITKAKNKISTSGQVEKIIDMNEQWKTMNELENIASSYIRRNTNESDEIKMLFDKDYNLQVGDIVKVDKSNFFVKGNYIITDKRKTYVNNINNQIEIILRKSNFLDSFIDLFRTSETEEKEEKNYNLITVNYQEEGIKERYEVV